MSENPELSQTSPDPQQVFMAEQERKTRPIPKQEKIDRSMKQIWGVNTMTDSDKVQSDVSDSMATIMETLHHLQDEAIPNFTSSMGNFGHPFSRGDFNSFDQAGITELGEQMFKLWLEQAKAWQSYIEQIYSGSNIDWSQLTDYASIFSGIDAPVRKKRSDVVVIANRNDLEAEVHWREDAPSTQLHCPVLTSVKGHNTTDEIDAEFRASLDGETQVLAVNVSDTAESGTYVGVIFDDNEQDFGYLRIVLTG